MSEMRIEIVSDDRINGISVNTESFPLTVKGVFRAAEQVHATRNLMGLATDSSARVWARCNGFPLDLEPVRMYARDFEKVEAARQIIENVTLGRALDGVISDARY